MSLDDKQGAVHQRQEKIARNSHEQANLIRDDMDCLLIGIELFPVPELIKRRIMGSVAHAMKGAMVAVKRRYQGFESTSAYMTHCEKCEMTTLQSWQGIDRDDEGNKLELSHCLTCGTMNVVKVDEVRAQ